MCVQEATYVLVGRRKKHYYIGFYFILVGSFAHQTSKGKTKDASGGGVVLYTIRLSVMNYS